jgi:hypothetical protein
MRYEVEIHAWVEVDALDAEDAMDKTRECLTGEQGPDVTIMKTKVVDVRSE